MSDILDARIPIAAGGGTSISVRDSFDAEDSILVPILTTGLYHRANDLGSLPAYVRVPLVNGGSSISAGDIVGAGSGLLSTLSLEDGSGAWEWETGSEIEWPGEAGVP